MQRGPRLGPWGSLALAALVACARAEPTAETLTVDAPTAPPPAPAPTRSPVVPSAAPTGVLEIPALTAEQRQKGFDECNPADPLGLGPYAPFIPLLLGKLMVPQKGGHTPDFGFDVLIHFNGGDAARKLLTQVARGISLVIIDKPNGGAYEQAFGTPAAFGALRKSIERALVKHTGKPEAHIRHLGISAWSAGTMAVDKILSQQQTGIDAVVILDGLHGAWKLHAPREQKTSSLDVRFVKHEVELARRAQKGELSFFLTHSHIDPGTFPSTFATAASIVEELGLTPLKNEPRDEPHPRTSSLDVGGLHVWGHAGNDVKAHCSELALLAPIVSRYLEPAWNTPAMDREVPPTPLWGGAPKTR